MNEHGAEHDPDEGIVEPRAVPILWTNLEDVPIAFANNFAVQVTPDAEFIISFAQLVPPLLVEPTAEEMAAIESVHSRTIFRVGFSVHRARLLSQLLQSQLAKYPDPDAGQEKP
jgi:hypothetical protein